ncbi:MAG: hydroxymethylglutaryl-CoA lyase [Gammaproteobacteria bacterium]|nr:hydroxymethylglutaryl-CoA lyase [Gammaproteobacteria bacterium]
MNPQNSVQIVEVATRDGFQAVKPFIETETKINVIEALIKANFQRLEVGAFVSPKAIAQMADTAEIHQALAPLKASEGIRLSTLVPNAIGGKRALEAGISDLVFVLSASESHNNSNVRRSIAESLGELEQIVKVSRQIDDFHLRVNIATVFDCPYEGRTADKAVLDIIERTLDMDTPVEFGLCDTTGRGFPDHVESLCGDLLGRYQSDNRIGWAFHGHDTYGLGVANALYAYNAGIRIFDAAAAGLGGCPFAPGASGNTASEDLVFTFENMGISTGIDLDQLLNAAALIDALPGVDTGGHVRLLPRSRVSS